MMVYVVMGNDYPDAVFSTEEAAEAYCEKKRQAEKKENKGKWQGPGIFWRVHHFQLDAAS
jgi:hypothetical protein